MQERWPRCAYERAVIASFAGGQVVGRFVFGFSFAATAGLFGDSDRQRIEDAVIAFVGLGVMMAARWQLLRLGGS